VSGESTGHLACLPGTGWQVWRDALLRSTGFPADGLDRFAVPAAATAADDLLAGRIDRDAFDARFADAAAVSSRVAWEIAGEPLFREAVTWQNPSAAAALAALRRDGPVPDPAAQNKKSRYRRRIREELVARYWQRYCAKNESVGFFGPVAWIRMDPDVPGALVKPGAELVRDRRVSFEHWALAAFADSLAADPGLRPLLPVRLRPHLNLRDGQVLRPARPPVDLTPAEAAVLARCDGRPAAVLSADLAADPDVVLRKESDAFVQFGRLADRGLVSWGLDLPVSPDAEPVLADALAALADPAPLAAFDRLRAARDAVAAASGDPDRLATALSTLDDVFTDVVGAPARRRAGQMYAGRALCYEDTVRDLDAVLGGPVLDAIAAPLELLLRSVRWLSAAIADAYTEALRAIHAELAADLGTTTVPAGPLWYLAQEPLFGRTESPADAVTAEFVRRWATVFGEVACAERIDLRADDVAATVAELFPAARPGWSGARLHSPDLSICARDVEAIEAGEFRVVLGELHAAWHTFDCAFFVAAHEEPSRLRTARRHDLGTGRALLLHPADFPRLTGRLARCLDDPADIQLAFTDAPGADPARVVPITALTVAPDPDGDLVATAPDGRTWPLLELFGELVAMHTVEAFKLVGTDAHTPRITIDRLVVARRTWRTTIGESGLADASEFADRFLAARRWRRETGLPERVFVKIATETKPVFVDFTAPRYVSAFCAMVRSAHIDGGDAVRLTVSEMLPDTGEAWLPDALGRRYFSELRMQVRDPEPAR
jgi:lantibiotic biosynthesis dehydratase-like protein